MGYLDPNKHDIFVSYAHSDHFALWYDALREELTKYLNHSLGLKGDRSVDVWMDYRLAGNKYLTSQLEGHVKNSTFLLILMSNFYLDSPWCKDEARWFADQCKASAADDGRFFVVRCEPTDESQWPDFLKDERGAALTGFPFFPKGGVLHKTQPFGHPAPDAAKAESKAEFFEAVSNLTAQMYDQFRSLSQVKPVPIPPRPRMTRARLPEPPPERHSSASVFLAIPTEDVAQEQEELRAKLNEAGFGVLPAPEQSNPSLFPQLFEALAPNCLAAALVAGSLPGRGSPIAGQPFVRWQHEQIVRLGLPHVVWQPPTIDVQAIRDPDYRTFIGGLSANRDADAASVVQAVSKLMPGAGGPRRDIFLDAAKILMAGGQPEPVPADPMEEELRAILKNLNARVFPLLRRRPTAMGLSEIEEHRRRFRAVKAQCDAVLLLLQNPEVVPDEWLIEFERDLPPSDSGRDPPRCAVIDATGSYEASEDLQVFHYPNPTLPNELRAWLH